MTTKCRDSVGLFVLLSVAVACFLWRMQTILSAPPQQHAVNVYFSPKGGAEAAIVAEIAAPPPQFWQLPLEGTYWIVPLEVKDGDTIKFGLIVPIDRGRIYGVNAPEKNTPEGKAAKAFAESIIPVGKLCEGRILGKEKFGGTLVDVKLKDGRWFSKAMIEEGFAAPWDGRGPKPLPAPVKPAPKPGSHAERVQYLKET